MDRDEQAAIVYDIIWTYLIENNTPPTSKQIAHALGWEHEDVLASIAKLRQEDMLSLTTLKPARYETWWLAQVCEQSTMLRAGTLYLSASGRLVKREEQ